MKKTLVAVAAIAAFSTAQAEVTITGVVETAVVNTGGATLLKNGTNGTEIDFGLSDDLGNGLKATASVAVLASPFDGVAGQNNKAIGRTTSSGATGSVSLYNSYIGLSSADFGSVKLGQQFSPTFNAGAVGDVGGRNGLSSYQAGGLTGQVASSITYSTPTFAGLTVQVQKALDSSSAMTPALGKGYQGYSVTYANGGLTAAIAGAQKSTDGTTGGLTEQVAGINYDFGMAKLYAGWSGKNASTTLGTSASGVGIAVPLGAVTLSVGTSKQKTTTANDYTVVYAFSKRTLGYAGMNTTTAAKNISVVGIRHNF
jgi:predicted porin